MTSVLVVIDQPFRGVVERQFADAVHLARVGRLQFGRVSILLIGEGVLLASPPTGEQQVAGPQALRLAALTGTPVLVDEGSAAAYGLAVAVEEPYEVVDAHRIASAYAEHDHVWHI